MERQERGQIREGGCEQTFHCLIQTCETCTFTVPPCSCSIALYKQCYTLADFLPNWNFRGVFSKYCYFAVRISEAAMAGDIIFFRVPRSSFRVRHCAEGCIKAQKGLAQLRKCSVALRAQLSSDRVQRSSVGCSLAQRVQNSSQQRNSVECSISQSTEQLNRVQCSSFRCSGAQECTGQLSKMQCSSEGCSLAQWKDIHTPGDPSSGLRESFGG